jgi:hypothetical protein
MIKLQSNGVFLDVIDNGSIQLTKSVQDVENYVERTGGGYSIPFTMPFTPTNNLFFANYFSVSSQSDGVLFDATTRTDVIIEDSGVIVLEGFMQLISADLVSRVYEVVCFEQVVELTDTIRNKTLRDLAVWDDYDHTFNLANIEASWTGNLFNRDVVYPAVDYGDKAFFFFLAAYDNTFRPWVKLKALFDAILSEAGVSYTSNFITNEPRFNQLYFSLANEGIVVDAENYFFRASFKNTVDINILFAGAIAVFRSLVVFDITSGNVPGTTLAQVNEPSVTPPFASGVFTPLSPGAHDMRVSLNITSVNSNNVTRFPIVFDFNCSIVDSNLNTIATVSLPPITNRTVPAGEDFTSEIITFVFQSVQLSPTQSYSVVLGYQNTFGSNPDIFIGTDGTYWEMLGPPSASVGLPISLRENAPDISQLNLLRSIIQQFNLVVEKDDTKSNHLNIEPYNDYIDAGGMKDWTDKVDLSKEIKVKPTTELQAKFNVWKFADDNDYFSSARELGAYRFESNNEFAQGEQQVELVYGAPTTHLRIPYGVTYRIIGEKDGSFQPIPHKPRIAYLKNNGSSIIVRNTLTNQTQTKSGALFAHHVFQLNNPIILPFDTNTTGYSQFFDLTFNSATNYRETAGIVTNTLKNSYTTFWQRYVNEIYNNEARIVEAYFMLSPSDLLTFKFNDKVFFKDQYYRVLEISNYSVGENVPTKVTMISLTGEALSPFKDCVSVPTDFNSDGTVTFSGTVTADCCARFGYTFVNGTCRWRPLGGIQIDPPSPTISILDLNQPQIGVCCVPDDETGIYSCEQLTQQQCTDVGGVFFGQGADCSECEGLS